MNLASRIRRLADFAGRYVHATALVAHAFTLGLASRDRRQLIARLAREASYPRPAERRLPEIAIDDVARPTTAVALPHPVTQDGNVTLLELVVLARIVAEIAPSAVFEIGTFDGRTAVTLAANAPEGSTIYTLDLPADHATRFEVLDDDRRYIGNARSGTLLRSAQTRARIVSLFGDSATLDLSPYHADVVFIDGSHAYDYVLSDSRRAFELLRDGRGIVLWHDYGEWDDVTRALNELYARDPRFRSLRHIRGTSLAILRVNPEPAAAHQG